VVARKVCRNVTARQLFTNAPEPATLNFFFVPT
jgi:hypothetical protein